MFYHLKGSRPIPFKDPWTNRVKGFRGEGRRGYGGYGGYGYGGYGGWGGYGGYGGYGGWGGFPLIVDPLLIPGPAVPYPVPVSGFAPDTDRYCASLNVNTYQLPAECKSFCAATNKNPWWC